MADHTDVWVVVKLDWSYSRGFQAVFISPLKPSAISPWFWLSVCQILDVEMLCRVDLKVIKSMKNLIPRSWFVFLF